MAIDKIALVIGGGELPKILADELNSKNIKPYIIALKGSADIKDYPEYEGMPASIAKVGKIVNYIKENDIDYLTFMGKVVKPDLASLIPDGLGLKLLKKLNSLKDRGDNNLFSIVTELLEEKDIKVVGVKDLMPSIIAEEGLLTKHKPSKYNLQDVDYGVEIAKEIGRLDIGQAVIVQQGNTVAVEGLEGTDELIKRSKDLIYTKKNKAILVKFKKPDQNDKIDIPVIGLQTLINCHENNIEGLVIHAGETILFEKEKIINYANKHKIFIQSVRG